MLIWEQVYYENNANCITSIPSWAPEEKNPRRPGWATINCLPSKNQGQLIYLQTPISLPAGISHFLEAHTTSRLQGSPAGCGGLHCGGVKAKIQTLPSLQSASLLHSSAAKAVSGRDSDAITAIGNRYFLRIFGPFLMVRDRNDLI